MSTRNTINPVTTELAKQVSGINDINPTLLAAVLAYTVSPNAENLLLLNLAAVPMVPSVAARFATAAPTSSFAPPAWQAIENVPVHCPVRRNSRHG